MTDSIDDIDTIDINYLMGVLGCSEEKAIISLLDNNYDPVYALASYSFDDGEDSSMDVDGPSYDEDEGLVISEVNISNVSNQETVVVETPDSIISEISEQTSCCICMADFDDNIRTSKMKCGHKFCTDCIMENIANAPTNKNKCPLCRFEICSEIVCPEVKELEEYAQVIESQVDDIQETTLHYKNALLYLYDENEERSLMLWKSRAVEEIRNKEIVALRSALKRSHQHLSAEIVRGHTTLIPYKKCSQCKCYGHNRRMCMSIASNFTLASNFDTVIDERTLRDTKDIINSIMPDGNLYDTISNHFID